MKKNRVSILLRSLVYFLCAFLFLPLVNRAATFTVSPNVISNDYKGVLSLEIGGLTNGEPVLVEHFFDFNGNAVPDAGEFVLQSFPLVNGQAFVIGGVTNLHVPGDLGTAQDAISAQLNMSVAGFEQKFVGKHIFRLSSPYGRFPAVLVPFTVTNSVYSANLSGLVTSSGTNVPYASVIAFISSGDGMEPRIGTAADGTGHYALSVPPGTYMLLAFKAAYVCDMSSTPIVTLASGANTSTNVALQAATRTISGRVADLGNSSRGLGGLLLPAESQDGKIGVAFTDSTGNFAAPAMPGLWQVGPDDSGVEFLGYVGLENKPGVDTTSGNVSGVSILVPKATALFTGLVRDGTQPVSGLRLYGHDEQYTYSGGPISDLNGRYFFGVNAGTWNVQAESLNPQAGNYIFSSPGGPVNVLAGQVITRDFSVKAAPYTVSGYVKTTTGSPVADVEVYGWATLGTETFSTGTRTDSQGFFSMNAATGQWNFQISCDGDNGLANRGFRCVSSTQVSVGNANTTVNFTVQACTGAQITTASLPAGEVGAPYDAQVQGEGCGSYAFWSLSPGSAQLPPGLNLISDSGWLTGSPSQAGTFTFSLRLSDNLGHVADRQFTVTIGSSIPLEIVMQLLPDATNGTAYATQIQANGGKPPYSWSLALGSGPVPPGLSFASNGSISGTPTATGTWYFYVQVIDSASTVKSAGPFLITVRNPPAPPLTITTSSLPDGTVGQWYSGQLQASGGVPAYVWGLAVGSANLPAGLNLNSSGQITGTPSVSGTFYFMANVTDQASTSTMRLLSMTIQPGTMPRPTLSFASRLEDGRFAFTVNGTQGITYTIQTSSNLQDWTNLRTTNASSGPFLFVDDSPPGPGSKFYRIRVGQ